MIASHAPGSSNGIHDTVCSTSPSAGLNPSGFSTPNQMKVTASE